MIANLTTVFFLATAISGLSDAMAPDPGPVAFPFAKTAQDSLEEELEQLLAEERRDADRNRRLGERRRALRTLGEHLDEEPGDAWSRALRAQVQWDSGDHDAALSDARRAVDDAAGAPREVRALTLRTLAEFLLQRGLAGEALELLEGSRDLQTRTDARDGWLLGRALLGVGRRKDAFEAWRDASEGELGASWERLLARARCERRLGSIQRASRTLVEADKLAVADLGSEPEVLVELGSVYFEADGEVDHKESQSRSPGLLYKEALRLAPDHELGLVELFKLNRFNWNRSSRPAHEVLDELLLAHPNSIDGLIAATSAHLGDGQLVAVRERLAQLDELAAERREVRTLHAALAWVEHRRDDCRAILDALAEVDPGDGRPAGEVARLLCELYRFSEAQAFGAEAVERDRGDVDAWTQYGRALANSGREDEAREAFMRAIDLAEGRQNAWRHNLTTVLGRMNDRYMVADGEGDMSYAWEPAVDEVLATYMKPFYAEARAGLAERYGFTPDPVKIEVFSRHQDFSVRSTGFEGFPALGVCFGPVVTAVSPTSELRGSFSWARTAFHEFSHVVHLGLSHNRCPRWITEGLATWEEEERNPSWTRNMRREVVDSLANGTIIPVRELNRAFRGPRILFGYYQGGLLCRMLIEQQDFPPMIRLLEAFDRGLDLDQALDEVFGKTPEQIDAEFDAWLREWTRDLAIEPRWSKRVVARLKLNLDPEPPEDVPANVEARAQWAEDWCTVAWSAWQRAVEVDAADALRRIERAGLKPPRASFLRAELALSNGDRDAAVAAYQEGLDLGGDDFRARMALGRLLLDEEKYKDAEQQFIAAETLFPGFDEPGLSAELYLAQVYAHLERPMKMFAARERWLDWNPSDYALRIRVARWHAEAGRHAEAAELYAEANEVDPFRRELHLEWGASLLELGQLESALREFDVTRMVPGELDPDMTGPMPDEVTARLGGLRAQALRALGRIDEAREEAAAALELDPACEAALTALEGL